jgi:bifunctional DNase/RNase
MLLRKVYISSILTATAILSACSSPPPDKQILMKFHTIQQIPGSNSIAVILTEEKGENFLPLFVDRGQALSIYLGHSEIPGERPLSHDLMANMLKSLKAKVERIVITDLRNNIYYAELELRKGTDLIKVDARPSDAIALALRVHAPIFAMQHLLESSGSNMESEEAFSQVRVKSWGFTVQPVLGTLKRFFEGKEGVLVTQNEVDSPAKQAELLPGDLVMSIDGEKISDLDTFSEVMAERSKQARINLEIFRDCESRYITLTKHN